MSTSTDSSPGRGLIVSPRELGGKSFQELVAKMGSPQKPVISNAQPVLPLRRKPSPRLGSIPSRYLING